MHDLEGLVIPGDAAAVLLREDENPLVSGDPETVHTAGVSARGRTISEEGMDVEDLEDYVVDWPLKVGAERG